MFFDENLRRGDEPCPGGGGVEEHHHEAGEEAAGAFEEHQRVGIVIQPDGFLPCQDEFRIVSLRHGIMEMCESAGIAV